MNIVLFFLNENIKIIKFHTNQYRLILSSIYTKIKIKCNIVYFKEQMQCWYESHVLAWWLMYSLSQV